MQITLKVEMNSLCFEELNWSSRLPEPRFCRLMEVMVFNKNFRRILIERLRVNASVEAFRTVRLVHTENYHCNNNKVHFVGAILLHITNRCVTNTICFFK